MDRDYSKGTSPVKGDDLVSRIVGKNEDGHTVQNVTDKNRYEVVGKPVAVNLVSHDGKRVLARVHIANTRERPDVVMFQSEPYEVVTTLADPAIYRACMFLEAKRG